MDWLPWNHVFGGSFCFNAVLFHGGTLYIDDGSPSPQLAGRTVDNLRAVSPTVYFNVPRGYEVLLPYLEQDGQLRQSFLQRLDLLFYGAAALPPPLWKQLNALAIATRGKSLTNALCSLTAPTS